MKFFFVSCLLLTSVIGLAQPKTPSKMKTESDSLNQPFYDSLIKQRLIDLALKSPALNESDAMINSAKYELKASKTFWLNTVVLSGNVNEFVINDTKINGIAASTLYPKYNIGVNLPLGVFARQEKNISKEKVKVYESQKETKKREIKKEVLIRYENYKEQKELYELQKLITDSERDNYDQKQKDFATGETHDIGEVNKEYQLWLDERGKLLSKEKDLKVAQIEVEELIGTNLIEVIRNVFSGK